MQFKIKYNNIKMVLAELGTKIKEALIKLNGADVIDKKLLDEVLNALGIALIKADVKIKFVATMQQNIRNKFDFKNII